MARASPRAFLAHSPAGGHDIMVHVLTIVRVTLVSRPAGKRDVKALTRCSAICDY